MMESFRVLAKYQNGLTPKSERFDTVKQRHRILFFARNKMQENSIIHCRTQFSGNFCRGFDFPIRQPSAHMIQLQYTNLCSETGSSNLLTFATSSTALCNRVTQHIITLHSISSPFPDSFEVVPTFGPSNQIYVLETFWNPVRVWRGWRWTQRFHICSDIMVSS